MENPLSSLTTHLLTFERELASLINGARTISKPYFSRFSVVTQAISCIPFRVDHKLGAIFPNT